MQTAVLGATGLVGRIMLQLLEQRAWVDVDPLLLGSQRSAGVQVRFRGRDLICHDAAATGFAGAAVALFSAGAAASRLYAPRANEVGCWVVDNSSAFRMEPSVPLVVPEINPALVPSLAPEARGEAGVIANPNCSTIQIALAVAPLQKAFGLREVHVTTLQAVSGAGKRAVVELAGQAGDPANDRQKKILSGELSFTPAAASGGAVSADAVFPRPIAFNAIPEIGGALPDGSFQEEAKVLMELRKILDQPDLAVTCTAIRVPIWNGHSAAVRVVCAKETTVSEAGRVMSQWPGLQVEASPHGYSTPAEASGDGAVHVGRLRQDPGRSDALLFWVVADNLLKGAALNAVQIAELLVGTS